MKILQAIMNRSKPLLTSDQMKNTLALFAVSSQHVISQRSNESKATIEAWVKNVPYLLIPTVSLRSDSLTNINDSIFSNEEVRDFIFDLSFRFFSLSNTDDQFMTKLSNTLANSISLDNPKFSIVPAPIKKSLSSHIELTVDSILGKKKITIEQLLESNKHLILVYLFCLTAI
jgi:hypothetical protein